MVVGIEDPGAGSVDGVGVRWAGGEKPLEAWGGGIGGESGIKDKANQVD